MIITSNTIINVYVYFSQELEHISLSLIFLYKKKFDNIGHREELSYHKLRFSNLCVLATHCR